MYYRGRYDGVTRPSLTNPYQLHRLAKSGFSMTCTFKWPMRASSAVSSSTGSPTPPPPVGVTTSLGRKSVRSRMLHLRDLHIPLFYNKLPQLATPVISLSTYTHRVGLGRHTRSRSARIVDGARVSWRVCTAIDRSGTPLL